MNTNSSNPYWVTHTRHVLLTPFRFLVDLVFCIFVVVAAYSMLIACWLLSAFDNCVIAPWRAQHQSR